jgi:hypothetical protein
MIAYERRPTPQSISFVSGYIALLATRLFRCTNRRQAQTVLRKDRHIAAFEQWPKDDLARTNLSRMPK